MPQQAKAEISNDAGRAKQTTRAHGLRPPNHAVCGLSLRRTTKVLVDFAFPPAGHALRLVENKTSSRNTTQDKCFSLAGVRPICHHPCFWSTQKSPVFTAKARMMIAKTCRIPRPPVRRTRVCCPCVSASCGPVEGAAVQSICLAPLLDSTSACHHIKVEAHLGQPWPHESQGLEARIAPERSHGSTRN